MQIAQSQALGRCDDCCWDSELWGMRCCMSPLIPPAERPAGSNQMTGCPHKEPKQISHVRGTRMGDVPGQPNGDQ